MTNILGIIGGSGLYKIDKLHQSKTHDLNTPWGRPSDSIVECSYEKKNFFFIPRHGSNHNLPPSQINYRANIDALKQLGVTDVLSISSVGSLNETLTPGEFIIIDQYIDMTKYRKSTFFDDDIVVHVSMANPTDKTLMQIAKHSLNELSISFTNGGSYVCIEGPQFSSYFESKTFQNWGCDVIGMTSMPEAKLCKEASLRYVNIGMITDYDCWHPNYDNVEVSNVIKTLNDNATKAKRFMLQFILEYSEITFKETLNSFNSLVTPKDKIKEKTIHKLKNIMPDLLK